MASLEDSDVVSDSRQQCRPTFLSHFRSASDDANYVIQLDHGYARPWNTLVDLHSRATPACMLFMSKFPRSAEKEPVLTGDIDVESVEPINVPPYDQEKARLLMTECERNINFARAEEIADEAWEERVNREGWSATQTRLFNRVVKALQSDRLARLAFTGHVNEPVMRRLCIDKTAKRVRQALAGAAWDPTLTRWLHNMLISVLGQSTLAAYLNVLQTICSKAPSQISAMIGTSDSETNDNKNPKSEALKLLLKRPWDPIASFLSMHQLNKLPQGAAIVLVPDLPTDAPSSPAALKRAKFWSTQLSVLGRVSHVAVDSSTTTTTQFVSAVESAVFVKCAELHSRHPERPIILIGWQVGAIIGCRLSSTESVAAVVALGFPTQYVRGGYSDAEEMLVENKIPVLFVVGQNATTCCIDDLEDMREHMPGNSSLVIVGGSDDRLRMSHSRRRIEGVTQSMVDRCILDKIGEFLGDVLTQNALQVNSLSGDGIQQESDMQYKHVKNNIALGRSSNLFDPLAGGDTQALLTQASDPLRRPLKRGREAKKKKRNHSHISEMFAANDTSAVGRQLIISSSPIIYTQTVSSHDSAVKQWHCLPVSQMNSAATSALKERLKKPPVLPSSMSISFGCVPSSLISTSRVGSTVPRASTSQIQQLLISGPGRSTVYQLPVTAMDRERFWSAGALSHPSRFSSSSASSGHFVTGTAVHGAEISGHRYGSANSMIDFTQCSTVHTSSDKIANVSYVAKPIPAASTSTRTRTIKIPKHYDM